MTYLALATEIRDRMYWLFRYSQTSAVRFFFGLASIGMASFMGFSTTVHNPDNEYVVMLGLMRDDVWALIFFLNGAALVYGVISRHYNLLLLWFEGILGMAAWIAAAFCMTIAQGTPGAAVCGALIASWICYRYPTHLGRENG